MMKHGFFPFDPKVKRQSMHWKTPTSPRMKKKIKNKQVESEDNYFL